MRPTLRIATSLLALTLTTTLLAQTTLLALSKRDHTLSVIDPATLKIRAPLPATGEDQEAWIASAKKLQAAGVTHLTITPPLDRPAEQGLQRVIAARQVLDSGLA